MSRRLLPLLLFSPVACRQQAPSKPALLLRVEFESDLTIDQLRVDVEEFEGVVPPKPSNDPLASGFTTLVILPEELADTHQDVRVDGLRLGEYVASGTAADVWFSRDEAEETTVVLSSCEDGCESEAESEAESEGEGKPCGVWNSERLYVYGSSALKYTSIAVDAAGGVHISCVCNTEHTYIYRPFSGEWTLKYDYGDSVTNADQRASLAIDGETVLAALNTSSHFKVYSRDLSETEWTTEMDILTLSAFATLEVGENRHFAWQEAEQLHYWNMTTTVGGVPGEGSLRGAFISMAVAGDGTVHIAHYRIAAYEHCQLPTDGSWACTTIAVPDATALGISLDASAEGTVHVAYQLDNNLYYQSRALSDAWSEASALLVAGDLVVQQAMFSLVVDPSGTVHIVYVSGTLEAYRPEYTFRDAGGFASPVLVDPEAIASTSPSLAADASGALHLSYVDGEELHYAHCP